MPALRGKSQAGARNLANDAVIFGEAMLRTEDGQPIRFWDHQKEDLRCTHQQIIHKDGRDTGKTANLFCDVYHKAMRSANKQGLVATPWDGALQTIISYFELQQDYNPLIKASIVGTAVKKPYYKVTFTNGYVLHFRMSGARGDAFRSLHVNHIWVDEGAYMPEKGWNALWRCQKNMRDKSFRIYSTPDGRRDTTYFRLTSSPAWRLFEWPSWLNPNWDDAQEKELLERYGSKDSPGWKHEVEGEHGHPAYGAFDMDAFYACLHRIPEYKRVVISGEDIGLGREVEIQKRIRQLLKFTFPPGLYVVAADLGYTADPTEIVIKQLIGNRIRCVFRLHCEHVSYDQQAEILAHLIGLTNAAAVAIDNGGNGIAVVQILLGLDKYNHLDLEGKLFGVDFGGSTVIGFSDKIDPVTLKKKEIKEYTKKFMTDQINGAMMRRDYELPAVERRIDGKKKMVCTDEKAEQEYSEQSYSTTVNGRIVYSKGNDHILDADRCAFYAIYQLGNLVTGASTPPRVSKHGRKKGSRKKGVKAYV